MKYISLFAGIGGFDLALNRLGHKCVYTNEWDKYAAQTYEKNFGYKPDTRDITAVSESEIPNHDLLVGGFPCQSFSVAGKRGGFNDTRGTMLFEIARILEAKRPAYLLLENVKGLLSHDSGRTFETIMRTLDELGYECRWQVLNSKNFGVPQNRERVFIIGHLRGQPRPQIFPIGENEQLLTKSLKSDGGRSQTQYSSTLRGSNMKADNTYIMQWARTAKGRLARREAQKNGRDYTPFNNGHRELKRSNKIFLGALTSAVNKDTLLESRQKIRRLTPVECERLQGFPDNWTQGVSDTQRYKQLGNAVTVNVVEEIIKRMEK